MTEANENHEGATPLCLGNGHSDRGTVSGRKRDGQNKGDRYLSAPIHYAATNDRLDVALYLKGRTSTAAVIWRGTCVSSKWIPLSYPTTSAVQRPSTMLLVTTIGTQGFKGPHLEAATGGSNVAYELRGEEQTR